MNPGVPGKRTSPATVSGCRTFSYLEAGDRIRTGDPQLGKLMLYRLSYARDTLEFSEGRAAPQDYPAPASINDLLDRSGHRPHGAMTS